MCLRCVCVGGVRICETGFYNLIFICFLCCWSLRVYTGQEVVYMQYTKLWDVILRSGQKLLEELRGVGINQPWQIYCEKYLSPKTGTGWVTVPQKCSKRKKHCSHVYRIKDHMFVCTIMGGVLILQKNNYLPLEHKAFRSHVDQTVFPL